MNPSCYVPQYGGWCAYAMGYNGEKVEINPESYSIEDKKLYLFYKTRHETLLFPNVYLIRGLPQE